MENKIIKAKELVVKHNQKHLLNFFSELNKESQGKLVHQILSTDFNLVKDLYINEVNSSKVGTTIKSNISPISSEILDSFNEETIKKYEEIGKEQISKGNVAVITMAGGQGTRLGHNGPKGTFKLGGVNGKTLFMLQLERLKKLSQENGKWIPWYIMTSDENHRETLEYFIENNYFDYPQNNIIFFTQEMLPLINKEGEIILKNKDELYLGPNGNGGVFCSLKKSGAIHDMNKRQIKWVFICGIDNALVKVADPTFIGYTIAAKKAAASKSVAKKHPDEKVGVFCNENNKPSIVEYTELPKEFISLTDSKGELLYGDANIIAHLFSMEVISRIADKGLPYHTAFKKISYIGKNGELINPEVPNVYKFESFIFDAFQYLDDMAILRVDRDKEFAPVKNSTGEDSPETAQKLLKLNNLR